MVVIADTSPVTALLHVGMVDILRRLFERVVIPRAVSLELLREHPNLPAWIEVVEVADRTLVNSLATELDLGESEAIALATELQPRYLIIDERSGRNVATRLGVRFIGLVGTVLLAKREGHIASARSLLEALAAEGGAYFGAQLIADAVRSVGET
jgi:predicted nucleic acid-binding protein